jgi:hypothetical protein
MRLGIDGLRAAMVLAAVGLQGADACGPWFPNRLLTEGDYAVLAAPVADFSVEIDRIELPGKAGAAALLPDDGDKSRQTTSIDLAELREALKQTNLTAADREALFSRYQDIREHMWDHLSDGSEDRRRRDYRPAAPAGSQPAEPRLDGFQIPEGIPGEFAEYLRGAVAYHRKRYEEARSAWTALLDRPADQRRNRTVWAAYMLGRSWVEDKPDLAVEWFEKTRLMAREGFRDSTGLAAASLGWQARAELRRGRYAEAIVLYLEQARAGDNGAHASLRMAVEALLKDDRVALDRLAAHPLARQVVTAYIISEGGPAKTSSGPADQKFVRIWLKAVERAGTKDMPGADRLAWVAYQYDDMDSARRWLSRAPQSPPEVKWLKAKLLLHDGKIDQAARLLAEVVRLFPEDGSWINLPRRFDDETVFWEDFSPQAAVWGEIGVLHMARHQYVEAMDALLLGDYWMDAAYVAERVLTIDELKRYVDDRYPLHTASAPATKPQEEEEDDGQEYRFGTPGRDGPAVAMRHLLARRLAREKRWKEARNYYPAERREVFDNYVTACIAGHDSSKSRQARSESLMEAAAIARWDGMELLGTEVEPDWATLDGSFEMEAASELRARAGAAEVVPSSADERKRLKQYVGPRKRFHYRYVAADLAWEAAELLPDESQETAKVLCEAGSWLKARDPKAADQFYKALVRRCGSTDLGKQAAQLKWFPPLPGNESVETQPGE